MMRRPKPKRSRITAPKNSSSAAIPLLAAARLIEVSTTAPRKPPIAPGTATRIRIALSMLPTRQCDSPEISVVGSLAACVAALAVAGATPSARSTVAEVTPKPIPSVPSTSWAKPPARAKAATNHISVLLSTSRRVSSQSNLTL